MPFMPLSPDLNANFLKSIRLIASDMDGTLTKRGKFTPALLETLTQLAAAEVTVVVVTGRSAGWVNGLVSYLPIAGAIAENGGIYYPASDANPELLLPIPDLINHRQKLIQVFSRLQADFPQLQESTDNRFRLTDWTFDIQGLTPADVAVLGDRCQALGWGFTHSTVQCHIKLSEQNKAAGLLQVLATHFPDYTLNEIVTVGDSPNDESLFDGDRFPHSIGVANVLHYIDQLTHKPAYVTESAEVDGFCELAQLLINHRAHD
jgi:hydroxymethylpyrimidine pyrophosphatase-like HAD family hydrolase